jgi:hypothetical protein
MAGTAAIKATAVKATDTIDPFAEYEVHTHNKKYAGEAFGVQFRNGFGRLDPLPKDADEGDIRRRVEAVQFFLNSHPSSVPKHVWDEDKGEAVIDRVEVVPTYTVTKTREAS